MRVLVTGGAGFIGSAVIRSLLEESKYKVINIDNLSYAGNLDNIPIRDYKNRYIFENIDICDTLSLRHAFAKYKPDAIMHLAAESHVDRSIESPKEFITTNIIGTFNLIQESTRYFKSLSKKKQKIFRFHHVSTDEVFGDLHNTADLFNEETPYSPSSPYSASKASSDHLVRAWGRTYNLPYLITNCSNNYGPYQFPEKLIPHMILNAIKGKSLPIYGNGMQIRDWLYVEDHAHALINVLRNGQIGETYNIGGHNEKTNLEVVQTICNILNEIKPDMPKNISDYNQLIEFVNDRPGHDLRYAIDASKIKNELGWIPTENFESGIKKTIIWYLNNTDWWNRVLSGEYRLNRIGDKSE